MLKTGNKNKYFLYFYALVMGLPIAILSTKSLQLPLSIIAVPIAFSAFILHPSTKEKVAFTLVLLLSTISSIIFSFSFKTSIIHSFLSQIWFFSPYLFFFLGSMSIKNKYVFMQFIKYLSIIGSLSIYALFVDIMINNHGIVRSSMQSEFTRGVENGSTIFGTIIGLKLYGAWGVNSLATYFLIIHATLLTFLFNKLSKYSLTNIFIWGSIFITAYFIFFSISRGAIIGLISLYVGLLLIGTKHLKKLVIYTGIIIIIAIAINWEYLLNIFDAKIMRLVNNLHYKEYADIASGRDIIFKLMLDQISSNVLVGRGFSGFGDISINLSTSSPHNQLLGALWKMGLLAFMPYIYFLYRLHVGYTNKRILNDRLLSSYVILLLVIFILLNLVWDNYTVPLLGAVIMFINGAIFKISGEKP